MKKTISLFLALLLAVSLSITAFAAEGSENIAENNGMASIKVSGVYAAGEEAAKLINVDIAWGAMSFIYTAGDAAWNPDEHSTTPGGFVYEQYLRRTVSLYDFRPVPLGGHRCDHGGSACGH